MTSVWPFVTEATEGLVDRACAAEIKAESILRGMAYGLRVPEQVEDIDRWARALEVEIRRRADASPDVDPALATALVQTMTLTDAIERATRLRQPSGH